MRGAKLFLEAAYRHGVHKVFGIVGGEAQVLRFDEVAGMDFYLTRHEFAAGIMADVYGRLTGRPQMCYSTFGPGATNLATGVCSAVLDRSAMLAVSAQVPRAEIRYNQTHQCVDSVAIIGPMAKFAREFESVEEIPAVVTEAMRAAKREVPGPSYLSFPLDLMKAEIADDEAHRRLDAMGSSEPAAIAAPDPSALRILADALAKAKRPIAIGGNAIIRANACAALREFVERYQIPISATLASKGILPADHPLSVGACNKYLDGIFGEPILDSLFGGCDLVLLIGYDFGEDVKPGQWRRSEHVRTYSLNLSPNPMGAVFAPDFEVVGELVASLRMLTEMAPPTPTRDLSALRRLTALKAAAVANPGPETTAVPAIIGAVRDALGPTGILCSDIGLHKQYAGLFSDAYHPNTFMCSNGCGTFGFGLPAGMAAALAHPDRRVAVVCGDGGFHSTSHDLETAARYRLPVVIVLLKDNAYGLIKYYQLQDVDPPFGGSVEFGPVDFVGLARANGVRGVAVPNVGALAAELAAAFAQPGPVLLEVPIEYRYRFDAPVA